MRTRQQCKATLSTAYFRVTMTPETIYVPAFPLVRMVETRGIEPLTPALQRCSTQPNRLATSNDSRGVCFAGPHPLHVLHQFVSRTVSRAAWSRRLG